VAQPTALVLWQPLQYGNYGIQAITPAAVKPGLHLGSSESLR
jgi:hypothetical protein